LLLVFAGANRAGADFFVTPFIGLKFAGDTNLVDLEQGASNTKLTLGATVGVIGDGPIGVEADFGYSPRFFERSSGSLVARSHVLTLMGNLIVTVPRTLTGYALRPFVSGGAGLMQVDIDDVAGIIPVDSNLFAVNVGGGAVGGLTNRTSIRFDLRYFRSVTNEDEDTVGFGTSLSFWRAAVGLTIR
jgi:hypothetical protein